MEKPMKSILIAVSTLVVFASASFAAVPDVIDMKKNVKFNHKAHAAAVNDCKKCHTAEAGGKIEGFGKDLAHKQCKECHTTMQKGPTTCKKCHL
jgi:hypothetical protein